MNFTISDDEIKQVIERLKLLQGEQSIDTEENHIRADELLCSVLPKEITEEYTKIWKWYA